MSGYSCCISDYIWSRDLTTTIKSTVVIMALFDQQQQQQEEQQNQVQPYGVCVGSRRIRNVQQVPYVPDMNMGRPLFRARELPAYPVREQQQHVMLQDRINQDVQHNMIQDNIAYNRRLYDDPQLCSGHLVLEQFMNECLGKTFIDRKLCESWNLNFHSVHIIDLTEFSNHRS